MIRGAGRDGVRLPATVADLGQGLFPALLEPDPEAGLDQPHVRADQPADEDVADAVVDRVRPVHPALLDQDAAEPDVRRDRRDLAGVVRLDATDRDERVAAGRERVRDEVLELAGLVATERDARVAVVALRPDRSAPEVLREPPERLQRATGRRAAGSGRTSRSTWGLSDADWAGSAPLSSARTRRVRVSRVIRSGPDRASTVVEPLDHPSTPGRAPAFGSRGRVVAAALSGLLAAATALAVGHLVASVTGPVVLSPAGGRQHVHRPDPRVAQELRHRDVRIERQDRPARRDLGDGRASSPWRSGSCRSGILEPPPWPSGRSGSSGRPLRSSGPPRPSPSAIPSLVGAAAGIAVLLLLHRALVGTPGQARRPRPSLGHLTAPVPRVGRGRRRTRRHRWRGGGGAGRPSGRVGLGRRPRRSRCRSIPPQRCPPGSTSVSPTSRPSRPRTPTSIASIRRWTSPRSTRPRGDCASTAWSSARSS